MAGMSTLMWHVQRQHALATGATLELSMGEGDSHSHSLGGSAAVKGTGTYRRNLFITQVQIVAVIIFPISC
jgi:hypothetical protein